jgi:hypothetical protein
MSSLALEAPIKRGSLCRQPGEGVEWVLPGADVVCRGLTGAGEVANGG